MEGHEVSTGVEDTSSKLQVENYRVGEANVLVGWIETYPKKPREFLRKKIEAEGLNPNKGVIFIGAWNWDPDVPIMRGISQKMADGFGQTTYQVEAKTDKIDSSSYATQAEGIAQFIAAHNLREVTLVGHSEGGIVAADLVLALERDNPTISIDGLVLMDSMGMYKRNVLDLVKKFVSDPIKVAPKEFQDSGVTPPEGSAMQLLLGIWRDMKYFGLRYPKEFARQLKGMASLTPALQLIKAPILILTAERDFVSDYRGYLPQQKINKRMEPVPSNEPYLKHEEMLTRGKARREYLRKNIVPQAENATMIVISKGAHHAGITDIRLEQAAKVASRIFERMRRKSSNTA